MSTDRSAGAGDHPKHRSVSSAVQCPPERGALQGQSGEQVPIDGHDLLHALLVQPLGMCAAGAAEPAAHSRCRTIQGRGDGAVPGAVGLWLPKRFRWLRWCRRAGQRARWAAGSGCVRSHRTWSCGRRQQKTLAAPTRASGRSGQQCYLKSASPATERRSTGSRRRCNTRRPATSPATGCSR